MLSIRISAFGAYELRMVVLVARWGRVKLIQELCFLFVFQFSVPVVIPTCASGVRRVVFVFVCVRCALRCIHFVDLLHFLHLCDLCMLVRLRPGCSAFCPGLVFRGSFVATYL